MNNRIMYVLLPILASIFTSHAIAQPSGTPVTIGEQITIESKVLDEQRSIIVGLPDGYGLSDARYPVLYVMDGSEHFHYTTGITEFLATNQFIPHMIVIAVNNTDRTRDMTPPSQEPGEQQRQTKKGGAENFQRFFAEELMPWAEQHYRTHPYNVLIGHSFGGLFAIHTLTTRPDLFDAYIAISPSMQWNGQRLVDQADEFFSSTPQLPISLYMSVGDEGGPLLGGTRKLAGVLDVAAPKDFLWQFDHMPRETHNTVTHASTYQGLEFVFANWALRNPYEVYTKYGLQAIKQFHEFGDQRYGTSRGIPPMTFGYLVGNMIMDGNLDGAVELMTLPSAMVNAGSSIHSFVAMALDESGDQALSTRFYRQALQLNPGDMTARNALDAQEVDYSDIVPEPQIDARVLQRYTGVYTSRRINDITIEVEDGRLFRTLDTNRMQLHPLNESEFYLLGADVRYDFQNSDNGDVSGIRVRQGDIRIFAERTEALSALP